MSGHAKKQKSVRTVGLDTMIMIWGMRQTPLASEGDDIKSLRTRARILLELLSDDNSRVVVPTVCVAELMIPLQAEQRGHFLATLQQTFVCPPFDVHAATIASELWQYQKSLPADARYKDRRLLKADVLIVASAKAAGATEFYSHDKNCRKLAGKVMIAKDLPTHHENLFRDKEIRDARD